MPNPAQERWFAIAAIQRSAARAPRQIESKSTAEGKRDWKELKPQQQAGIRCDEPEFWKFLHECYPDEWLESASNAPECVRLLCQVTSRAELETNHKARVIWKQLDDQYLIWRLP
jgi:hypothetical protein